MNKNDLGNIMNKNDLGNIMKPVFAKPLLTLSIISLLSACGGGGAGGPEEPNPPAPVTKEEGFKSSFYSTREIGSTTQCPNGGVEILSGIDVNKNGLLDDENTTTHVICHGADAVSPNISVEDASASQCPNGGKVLKVNTDELVLPLCNVNSVVATPTSEDYPAAKAMMEGFKNWITTLETLGNSAEALGDELNDKSQALEDLYGHGADSAIQSMGKVLSLMDGMVSAGVDSTLDLSTRGDIDATGTLTYSKTNNTMVASNVKVTMVKNNEAIVTAIEMPTIVLPESSGTRFELKLENVTATNTKASLALPIVEAILTTQNQVDDLPNTEDIFATDGDLALSIKLGDTDKLVTIKNLPEAGKEADQITFTGKLDAELVGYQLRIASVNVEQNYINPKTLNFAGDLSYDGKQVKVDLGFEMHNVDNYRFTEEAINGLELINDEDEIPGFVKIKATDTTSVIDENSYNDPSSQIAPIHSSELEDLNAFINAAKTVNVLNPGLEDRGFIEGETPGDSINYRFNHPVFNEVSVSPFSYSYQLDNLRYEYRRDSYNEQKISIYDADTDELCCYYDSDEQVFRMFFESQSYDVTYNPQTDKVYLDKHLFNRDNGEIYPWTITKAIKYDMNYKGIRVSIGGSQQSSSSDLPQRSITIAYVDNNGDSEPDEYMLTTNTHSIDFYDLYKRSNSLEEMNKAAMNYFLNGKPFYNQCSEIPANKKRCEFEDNDYDYDAMVKFLGTAEIDLINDLPETGSETNIALKIQKFELDRLDTTDPSYELHRKYTLSSTIELKGLKDNQGNDLGDVLLDVVAKRSGFLTQSGRLEFTLHYGGKHFKAVYYHKDYFTVDKYDHVHVPPREFVFEDGNGGKLVFNGGFNTKYEWGEYLGTPRRAVLYYNGLKHAFLAEHENGDWYIGYYDGTEDRLHQAQ